MDAENCVSKAFVQRSPGRRREEVETLLGTWDDQPPRYMSPEVVALEVSSVTSAGFRTLFSQGAHS